MTTCYSTMVLNQYIADLDRQEMEADRVETIGNKIYESLTRTGIYRNRLGSGSADADWGSLMESVREDEALDNICRLLVSTTNNAGRLALLEQLESVVRKHAQDYCHQVALKVQEKEIADMEEASWG